MTKRTESPRQAHAGRFRRVALLFALLSALAIAACGGAAPQADESQPSQTTDSTQAEASDEPVRLAFFGFAAANTFTQAGLEGVEEAAAELNATVRFFDGEFNPEAQLNQIETAIATGDYDAFVIGANDGNLLVPAVEDAIAKDIAVVAWVVPIGPDIGDYEPQVEGIASTVGKPFDENAREMAELTVLACADTSPCKVAILTGPAMSPFEQFRLQIVKEELAKHSQIEVVATADTNFLVEGGLNATQDVIQAHPDLAVVLGFGDQPTLGAEQAVADADMTGQVQFVGQGASKQGVEAVREGRWFGTVAERPRSDAKLAAELAIAAARGEAVEVVVDTTDQSPVGPVITGENAGAFEAEWDAG